MVLEQTQTQQVTITQAAANAVEQLIEKRELSGYALRVFISGGGCSGYQYGMALENNFRDSDLIIDSEGIQVVVDEVSINYLNGATIDYVEDVRGSGFKIENPNAMSSCGCGQSSESGSNPYGNGGGCSGC
jgi:iron-sulfur cluster assembly protein